LDSVAEGLSTAARRTGSAQYAARCESRVDFAAANSFDNWQRDADGTECADGASLAMTALRFD